MATTAFNSDVTCAGLQTTSTATLASLVFASGTPLLRMSSGTASVDFANMAANASSVITAAAANVAVGDTIVHQLGSNWSVDYLNINVISQCTIAGVISFSASNKSAGAINPDATTVRWTSFGF